MKVEGPSRNKGVDGAKKSGKASESDGSFGDYMASGVKGGGAASAAQSIARVDALLAVQAAEDPTERAARRRMTDRADGLLDSLDGIRHALLTGSLSIGQVIDMADVVASHREKITDPRLTAILDEIDLRAQIELAKIRKAMDSGV